MSDVNRRDAVKLAAGLAALTSGVLAGSALGQESKKPVDGQPVKPPTASAADDKKEDERPVTTYRIHLHNLIGKNVSLSVFGSEKTLSAQASQPMEAFKAVGTNDLPQGEYVYVARTTSGAVVAYGKLKIVKQVSIWLRPGVDQYIVNLFGGC